MEIINAAGPKRRKFCEIISDKEMKTKRHKG